MAIRIWHRSLNFLQNHLILILWISINIFLSFKTFCNYKNKPQYVFLREILGAGLCVSRASAVILPLNCILVIIPVCRTLMSFLFKGIHRYFPFAFIGRRLALYLSQAQKAHFLCACSVIIASVIHSIAHIINAFNNSRNFDFRHPELNWAEYKNQNPFIFIFSSWAGLTGFLMLFFLLIISITSNRFFRQRFYNIFSWTHLVFYPFLILHIMHPQSGLLKELVNYKEFNSSCLIRKNDFQNCSPQPIFKVTKSQTWFWLSLPLILVIFDRSLRFFRQHSILCNVTKVKRLADHVAELTLHSSEKFMCRPAQYILLQCSVISNIEWHPYTVIRCPTVDEMNFSILIRARGDWSSNILGRILVSFDDINNIEISNWNNQKHINFLVDGPYPSSMQGILECKIAICIAAGIGITPFASILDYLNKSNSDKPYRIHLIWIVRNIKHLEWFKNLLKEVHKKFWINNQPDRLEIQIFITKDYSLKKLEETLNQTDNILLSRIFKGRPNWSRFFNDWRNIYSRKEVYVFACGPRTMSTQVKQMCSKYNLKYCCKFKYIKETFF